MREVGIEEAARAAGGIGALARALGISQPAVSAWRRIPADRVLAVANLTGIDRSVLRPDLYPDNSPVTDEIDELRAREYDLLATLTGRAPTAALLGAVARIHGDDSPLGRAHAALGRAAEGADPDEVSREFFDLFIGVGRGELMPYASYYLTGFLQERPLARVREDMAGLGLERAGTMSEPEDHIAILLELMSNLASGRSDAATDGGAAFFARHLAPWAERFFADLEGAPSARFYRQVGALGRIWIEIEAEAFAIGD